LSILDPIDVYPLRLIIDPIKNAIISDPDTIAVIPRQLETSGRTSGLGEGSQLFEDAFINRRCQPV